MKSKAKPERRLKKLANVAREKTPAVPEKVSFRIVGIGASAGGLEALEQFLGHMPVGNGMAFIMVQHDATLLADESQQGSSLALQIMRYRSGVLGAALTIETKPEGGTVVTCCYRLKGKGRTIHAEKTATFT